MAMLHGLTRLFADFKLWNKVKSAPTLSISEDDIVVFVVGPTGSGKSWFIREATKGEWVESSEGYHPFTTQVQATRCELADETEMDLKREGVKGVVFVDTPSFFTGYDGIDAHKAIGIWIDRAIYKPRYLGMIYMHRIETDPAHNPTIQTYLKEFTAIPQISAGRIPLRLHIVMSYDKSSSNFSDSRITKRESMLRVQMESLSKSRWQPSMHQERFEGEPEVAWRAVEELFRTDHSGL